MVANPSSSLPLLLLLVLTPTTTSQDGQFECHSCFDITKEEVDGLHRDTFVDDVKAFIQSTADAGSCQEASSLVQCGGRSHCVYTTATFAGRYGGKMASLSVMASRCGHQDDDDVTGVETCMTANKMFPAGDSKIQVTGMACSCNQTGCNKHTNYRDLRCYSCQSVEMVHGNDRPGNNARHLREHLIASDFGGVSQDPCDHGATVRRCDSGDICALSHNLMISESSGTVNTYDVISSRCLNTAAQSSSSIPRIGCTTPQNVHSLDQWSGKVDMDVIQVEGQVCGCQGHLCNTPKDFVGEIKEGNGVCSLCKRLTVKFSEESVAKELERLLTTGFEANTPFCEYPKDQTCGPAESCATLTVTVKGTFSENEKTNVSGRLDMEHRHCMDAATLHRVAILGGDPTKCQSVDNQLLRSTNTDFITRHLTSVSSVSGKLCLCNSSLCNFPVRVLPEKPEGITGRGLRPELCATCLLLSIVTVYVYLLLSRVSF